jgi:hypothetical protein
MKILIVIMVLLGSVLNTEAQRIYYPVANDTVKGDTNYIPSESGYDLRNFNDGSLSFTFTHTDVADSLSFARIEWRNTTTGTWEAYTGNAALVNTTTDGQSKIYLTTPIIDRYVRIGIACASGDTVALTKQILLFKTE